MFLALLNFARYLTCRSSRLDKGERKTFSFSQQWTKLIKDCWVDVLFWVGKWAIPLALKSLIFAIADQRRERYENWKFYEFYWNRSRKSLGLRALLKILLNPFTFRIIVEAIRASKNATCCQVRKFPYLIWRQGSLVESDWTRNISSAARNFPCGKENFLWLGETMSDKPTWTAHVADTVISKAQGELDSPWHAAISVPSRLQ